MVLTIATFKTDKITAISVDGKSSGGSNYKSVKFAYDGGEVPPIRIDGHFRLFRFRNKNSDTYLLLITCDPTNQSFFRELNEVIAEESCKILKDESIKPEDFKLIRDNRSGRSVYAKIYSKRSGKVKCRISQGSYKKLIGTGKNKFLPKFVNILGKLWKAEFSLNTTNIVIFYFQEYSNIGNI